MINELELNQQKGLRKIFISRTDIFIVLAVFAFLMLNALKIALFNYYLLPNQSFWVFRYKLIMTVLLVVITYPILFKFKSKLVLLIFYILQIIYIVVNITYYLYFHNYLHIVQAISNMYEGLKATENFSAPISPLLLVAFIDLPFLIFIMINYMKTKIMRDKLKLVIAIIVICALCVTGFTEFKHYKNGISIVHIVKSIYSGESRIVERYGTVANNIVSVYSNRNEEQMVNSLKFGDKQSNDQEASLKPNFVIIQVESLDANIINQKYKESYVTPYLNSLSNESIYYPYMMSYHMGGGTSDSEFAIINSVEPLTYYPAIKLSSYKNPNSFAVKLTGSSYETFAFHGNVGRFYNRDIAFPRLGFQSFYDIDKMKIKGVGWGAPDDKVFNYTLERMKAAKEPFVSYTITMSSHGPFTNAGFYYNNKLYNDIQDKTTKDYFNSMSYVDQTLKDYIKSVKDTYKNTYILLFGDHTPNVNSTYYKQASFTMDNKYFEFVPMIVITPDNAVYKEEKNVASFLDISPTILRASGIKYEVSTFGHDLISTPQLAPEIPYRGSNYNRATLFDKLKNLK